MRKLTLTMAALMALTATAAAQTYQPSRQRAPAFQNYPYGAEQNNPYGSTQTNPPVGD